MSAAALRQHIEKAWPGLVPSVALLAVAAVSLALAWSAPRAEVPGPGALAAGALLLTAFASVLRAAGASWPEALVGVALFGWSPLAGPALRLAPGPLVGVALALLAARALRQWPSERARQGHWIALAAATGAVLHWGGAEALRRGGWVQLAAVLSGPAGAPLPAGASGAVIPAPWAPDPLLVVLVLGAALWLAHRAWLPLVALVVVLVPAALVPLASRVGLGSLPQDYPWAIAGVLLGAVPGLRAVARSLPPGPARALMAAGTLAVVLHQQVLGRVLFERWWLPL